MREPRSAILGVLALSLAVVGCQGRSVTSGDLEGTLDGSAGVPDLGPPSDVVGVWCLDNQQCGAGSYCHLEVGCVASGGKMGQCLPRPDGCYAIAAPVCGCDGTTYGNDCMAHAAGVNVADAGPCGTRCGTAGLLPTCAPDEICNYTACPATEGTCVKRPAPEDCLAASSGPVCSCDGTTYANDCERLADGAALDHFGACGGVTIVTDGSSYPSATALKATLINATTASVFLGGCGPFGWQKREAGVWVDQAPTAVCVWEGYAVEVGGGGQYEEELIPGGAGEWRVVAPYGRGCQPNLPLSEAGCSSFDRAVSAPVVVQASAEKCIQLQNAYSAALPAAKSCNPLVNTPQCQVEVIESLACNCSTFVQDSTELDAIQQEYQLVGCPGLSGLPVCPPVACPPVSGAACVVNSCQDY